MKWFYNMKISKKIITSITAIAVIGGLIIGSIGFLYINKINSLSKVIYRENIAPLTPIYRVEADFLKVRNTLRDMALSKSQDKSQYVNTINDLYKDLNNNLNDYDKYISSSEEDQNYKTLKSDVDKYTVIKDKIINLIQSNQLDGAVALMNGDGSIITNELDTAITKAFNINNKQADDRNKMNEANGSRAEILMFGIVLLSIAMSILIGLFVSKVISKPLNKMVDVANSISSGNLNVDLNIDNKDEIGILGQAFKEIIQSLKNLITDSNMLAEAAVEGNLTKRVDVSKHNGDYRKIVEGFNNTFNSVVEPLNEANEVLGKMAVNDFTVKMDTNQKGEFIKFANSINTVQRNLLNAEDIFIKISKGDISRLDEYKQIGRRSENDKLIPSAIAVMEVIQNLINESKRLVFAAADGDLKIRGNADKFNGGYRELIEGINNTMDAVVRPIEEASAVMKKMSEGDLTHSMNENYKGEYAKIKDSLNFTISFFNEVLNKINNSAAEVAAGARQVSDGSQALSQGAAEQASSVEQLTVSITEVAAQTKENAANANKANELALKAKENAEQGNEHMVEMLKSMEEINESSSSISKIIKVIDEIAFQTNILALNAAVEAARAGQHGKGFAVVAEEVRNLAARSANAAKETTGLIEGSIKKVETGTEIANATAKALNEIVEGVAKSANFVGEIASASNEQAAAIAQIDKGVEQVSQVVQTNSATAEESAAASEELSSQSQVLKEMAGKFKLKTETFNYSLHGKKQFENKKSYVSDMDYSYEEVATSSKPQIALSDNEFGKY
ncbi:HAMP domain-containing protein [Clostridium sp. P21]|uniref:HAMP domain-containing protein n=1 Tax=Clostridium muellerianum TaxID=2716538 RepID=A0A7Y0HNS2_9CLOT|nr:methyl-accepting chemotaxis protein [Clostridium muellerianum]NMM62311.1 HAMP domain-containing protein [Clostridium muellerianum]